MNDYLNKYLDFYLSNHGYQHAILINGKWGCGKTFFIKEKIEIWKKDKISVSTDGVILKPIYVSLYGISSTKGITSKIKDVLNPVLNSSTMKKIKGMFSGALKVATRIDFDIDGDGNTDGKISYDINSLGLLKSDKVKGNKILIFDDLERCDIPINILLGYINEFVEHLNCKVILLAHEGKIHEKYDGEGKTLLYKDFKEKLIGQTFTLEVNIKAAIDSFIEQVLENSDKQIFKKNRELIEATFIASKIENLRLLKKFIYDFQRFISQIDKKLKKQQFYKEYIKNLLFHFLVAYLEYKSGNVEVKEMYVGNMGINTVDVEKEINTKYNKIQDKYKIHYYARVISYSYITFFIDHGYSNSEALNIAISKSELIKSLNIPTWEKCWGWENLDDTSFIDLFKQLNNEFYDSKMENAFQLTHIVGIMFSLINNKIKCTPSLDQKDVICHYKKEINRILSKTLSIRYDYPPADFAWGKEYRERGTSEFKEILQYFRDKVNTHNSNLKDSYLKDLFEGINNDNFFDLFNSLNSRNPNGNTIYQKLPLFESVDGSLLAAKILELSNDNIKRFWHLFDDRFRRTNFNNHYSPSEFDISEIECIKGLCETLKIKLPSLKPIKKHNLQLYIPLLDEIISFLEENTKIEPLK